MTTQTGLEQSASFQALLESHYKQVSGADSLQKVRAMAWDQFCKQGLPSKDHEVFRYIKLRDLFNRHYIVSSPTEIDSAALNSLISSECKKSVLVFVNGHYAPALSNITALTKQVVISSLDQASKTYGALLNNHWSKTFKEENDPFAVINGAMHRDGIFIYVLPKAIIDVPLQILNVIDSRIDPMLMSPRLHIFVGAQSKLDIISSAKSLSPSAYCFNQVTDISLEDGAQLQLFQRNDIQSSDVWHFEAVRAQLKRDSFLNTVSVTNGGYTVRNDYRVALNGENGEAKLNGLWNLKDKREAHTNVLIEHRAPHCRSNQLFKGVLSDFSRSSFEGKIYVYPEAQKTEAFQLNNNLLLSDHVHADSKPNLEIFADDVKASHGATVGQLDLDQIFYMKSRGLNDQLAKDLLVHSFCQEILDMLDTHNNF